jgi:hypothetical protein
MKVTLTLLLLTLASVSAIAQQPDSAARLVELERKLDQAARQLEQLNDTVLSLRAEIAGIKGGRAKEETKADSQPVSASFAAKTTQTEAAQREFTDRLVAPEMGASEREETLQARPEIFIQWLATRLRRCSAFSRNSPQLSAPARSLRAGRCSPSGG